MTLLPLQVDARHYVLYIGFDDGEFDRLRAYDPGELYLEKLGEPWTRLELQRIFIGYCNAADLLEVQRLTQPPNPRPRAAIQYLMRGWRYRPEVGDHDGPLLSVKVNENETKQ